MEFDNRVSITFNSKFVCPEMSDQENFNEDKFSSWIAEMFNMYKGEIEIKFTLHAQQKKFTDLIDELITFTIVSLTDSIDKINEVNSLIESYCRSGKYLKFFTTFQLIEKDGLKSENRTKRKIDQVLSNNIPESNSKRFKKEEYKLTRTESINLSEHFNKYNLKKN